MGSFLYNVPMHYFRSLSIWTKILGIVAAALALIIAAWIFAARSGTPVSDVVAVQEGATTSPYTVELVPNGSAAPSLERKIPGSAPGLDASAYAILVANLARTAANLKANPDSFGDWLELGVERQMLGDYEGAAEAWIYLTKRSPDASLPYGNLGNLYAAYLKDFERAVEYYDAAIARDPSQARYYLNLHEIYRYYLDDTKKAINVLRQGVAALPNETGLRVTLARYYRDLGRKSEAKAEYDAAISAASGNAELTTSLETEKAAL